MATSGSREDWTAGARVFSGREDPTWPVPADAADAIVALWEKSAPARRGPEPPPLGYRGCWLRAPDGRRWQAGGGVVRADGEARADAGGAVERAILATAPAGALPPGLPG